MGEEKKITYSVIAPVGVNVRKEPDMKSDVVEVKHFNDVVFALEQLKDGWIKIGNGYIREEYLKKK